MFYMHAVEEGMEGERQEVVTVGGEEEKVEEKSGWGMGPGPGPGWGLV